MLKENLLICETQYEIQNACQLLKVALYVGHVCLP
jgi:hypothetical protein